MTTDCCSLESELMRQLNYELKDQGSMEVEAVQKIMESKFDLFRDNELKKYLHLVPYIYILVQLLVTRKAPARIQEIRLLLLTLLFQDSEIKSCVVKTTSWIYKVNYAWSLNAFIVFQISYLLKFVTLISIIISQQVIKEKKLAPRIGLLRMIRHFNPLDAMIILLALLPNIILFLYSFTGPGYWGMVLSIRAAFDVIECGNLFANFRLKGCDIDKNDMIGFGLTILAYTPRSIFPISFALYYICLGLLDKFRGWMIQVLKSRVPALLEAAPKNEVGDGNDQFLGQDRVLEYY